MMRELLRVLFGCRHQMRRERRTRYGCEILHFVCERCGHARPIVERDEHETRELFLDGPTP